MNFSRRHLVCTLALSSLAACSRGAGQATSQSAAKPPAKTRIGIAYALGGKGDQSYNDAASEALPALRGSFQLEEFAPLTLDDYSEALVSLAAHKPAMIYCVGFIYDTFVNAVAPRYLETHFCVLDGQPNAAPNTLGIQFRVDEASALAGIVAADRSTTHKIGFVGGSDVAPIQRFFDGYAAGAKRLDPNTTILKSYIGSGAEAFSNAARGKDIALRLLDAGADVLFHAAGSSGNGVIDAARERGKFAIGVDVDQTSLARGTVLTNVLKRFAVPMQTLASDLKAGHSVPGGTLTYGLKEGGVGITEPQGISVAAKNALAAFRVEHGASAA
jgi:basic membrane protein A